MRFMMKTAGGWRSGFTTTPERRRLRNFLREAISLQSPPFRADRRMRTECYRIALDDGGGMRQSLQAVDFRRTLNDRQGRICDGLLLAESLQKQTSEKPM
jgi:hypothetical protein